MADQKEWLIEIRDTTGNLVARLENAYAISLTEQINAPHMLKFSLPADDSKIASIVLTNELWLWGPVYAAGVYTRAIKRKFRLQTKRDVRN